ncbi:hypothetical protein ABIB40_003053 [Pedobacter sp. UYP30]|uniref:SPOR domain-containing protein n=1 Tax=Pedobacter sp. UYP30 TaxID=1756400 RepID=UPI0033959D8C
MKTILSISVLIFATSFCFAQKGKVTVIKDPMIDSLIAKRMEVYKTVDSPIGVGKPIVSAYGYRVQIYYGSDRREVFNQQNTFRAENPGINTYIIYKAPNYYLRVGDFRSRLEAQQLMSEIRPSFPTLFIFREKINAPTLEVPNND